MDLLLLLILVPPMLWPWISKYIWPHEVTKGEIAIHMAIVLVVTVGIWFTGMFGQTRDIEVWNGEVTNKKRVEVSCEHSYDCFCVDVSCGENCTTQVCQTCYDHSYDVDWRVYSNVQDTTNISRIDRQGLKEPPRWTQVRVGEPYADEKVFTNYIKGAPDSLFNDKDLVTKYQSMIPQYPNKIYDYYRSTHVLSAGVPVKDLKQWNDDMAEILKKLGPQRKSNVVVVLAKTDQVSYSKALKEAWLGGKKNDTVVVVGAKSYPKIDFVDVFSWSSKKILDVELRNEIQDIGEVDRSKIVPVIESQIMKNFKKRSMEEYAYLKDDVLPPTWLIVTTAMVSMILSAVVSFFTVGNSTRVYRRRW